MKRAIINALIDSAALVTLIPVFISSIATFWILPSGGNGFRGGSSILTQSIFLGLTRSEWRDIHYVSGSIFFILIAAHLVLHWKYFRNMGRILKQERNRD
jgi:hypothetical protein